MFFIRWCGRDGNQIQRFTQKELLFSLRLEAIYVARDMLLTIDCTGPTV